MKSSKRWTLMMLPLVFALGLAVACGDDETGPTLTITTPSEGENLDAGDVQVAVETEGFEVVDNLGDAPVEGEGHVHFYIDIDDVPTDPDEPAVTDEGTYHASATKSYTWEDVEPGEHTFAVQLVDNDHTALSPAIVEEVTVTVDGGAVPTDDDEDASPTRTQQASPTRTTGTSPTSTTAATPSASPSSSRSASPSPTP